MAVSYPLPIPQRAEQKIQNAYMEVTAFKQRYISYKDVLTNIQLSVMDISFDVLPNTKKTTCLELRRRIIELSDKLKNFVLDRIHGTTMSQLMCEQSERIFLQCVTQKQDDAEAEKILCESATSIINENKYCDVKLIKLASTFNETANTIQYDIASAQSLALSLPSTDRDLCINKLVTLKEHMDSLQQNCLRAIID